MTGFQTSINLQPAPGESGDFSSANPRASVLAGPGQLVAAAGGLTVGRFAWLDATGGLAGNVQVGTAGPIGFVHRGTNQGMILNYLGETNNVVPAGMGVTVHSAGDFWSTTKTVATMGQKAFASTTDGSMSTGAAGATIAGSVETKWWVWTAGAVGEVVKISTLSLS